MIQYPSTTGGNVHAQEKVQCRVQDEDRLGDSGRFEGVQRDLIGEQPQPQHGTQMEAGLPRERPHALRIRR